MLTKGHSKTYQLLSEFNHVKWCLVIKSVICGLLAGFFVVLYRFGIEYTTEIAVKVYAWLRQNPIMILPWVVIVTLAGLLIAGLVKYEPMATGSGIPQVKGLLLYGLRIRWYSVLVVRFISGMIASFFGLSLGREGPSIQIGASGAQGLAKYLGKSKVEENYLITGGAAAGLSAAFNAPLSGIIFTLEEIHKGFSGPIMITAAVAALCADLLSKVFFGLKPVLHFFAAPSLPVTYYIWLIPLGILSGLAGAALNKALLGFQTFYRKIPALLRPCIALLFALPCGLFLPGVLGGGMNLVQLSESASDGIAMIVIYLIVKFIFTCISFGSGAPGGIFMPILAIGALTGCFTGLAATYIGLPMAYVPYFAICAMAGTLSGSVKAPVTSILLIVEMTGSIMHMLPIAACSFIALFLSDILKTKPIYEALLDRLLNDGKDSPEKESCDLIEVPVEIGSIVANKSVKDIAWPEGSLLVGIHRGHKDLVPNGKTKILPGDYLVIRSTENISGSIHHDIHELCESKF